jgi:two-component system chemotaxis response regulator CheB
VTRVVICEGSAADAAVLRRALQQDRSISVVGVFDSTAEAIAALPRLGPDVVTLDNRLAGMSDLAAVREIMCARPVALLVFTAGAQDDGAAAAALAAGALAVVSRPDLDDPGGVSATALRRRIGVLGRAPVIRHPMGMLGRVAPRAGCEVIGICASTGGPPALAKVLAPLPASFAIPIVVVQHITDGFTDGLALWLDSQVALPVRVAAPKTVCAPGIWLAPDAMHLRVAADRTFTVDTTPRGGHRPSGDILLESLADTFGAAATGVILTGMGRDGAAGLAAIAAAGGGAIAQDEATSAVFGMPRAAIEAAGTVVLPLAAIGPHLGLLGRPA